MTNYEMLIEQGSTLKASEPDILHCEYCHTDVDGYIKPIEKNCHAYIWRSGVTGWHLSLKAKGWSSEVPIRFCPMCGRRLEDE